MAGKPTKESQLSKETQKRIDLHHAASAQRAIGAEVIAMESLNGPVKAATYELVQHIAMAPDGQKVQAAHAGIKQAATTLQANYEQGAVQSLGHARKLAMLQVESEAVEAQALIKQLMGVEVDLGGLMQILGDEAADSATAHAAASSVSSKWQNSKLAQLGSSQLKNEAATQMVKGLLNNGAVQSVVDMHAATLAFGAYGAQHTKAWNELAPGAKQPVGLKSPVQPVPFPLPPLEDEGFGTGGEQGLPYGWGEGMMQIWSAILDRATCQTCWALDGNMVPIGKQWPGVGSPPAHPRCRCIPVTLFVPEALSRKLPGIQIDYAQLKGDIRDYMKGSSLDIGTGKRHATDYVAQALQGKSPKLLTQKLQERRYFTSKLPPKPPKGGPLLPGTPSGSLKVTKELEDTKQKLGAAITKVNTETAKRKAAEAALAQAQADILKAQQAAKIAQVEGQAALRKAEGLQLPTKLPKPAGPTPQEKLEAMKQKAAAYKAEQAALAQQKIVAQAREDIELLKEVGYTDGPQLATVMKTLAKNEPKVFAEVWSQLTGKPAPAIAGKLDQPLHVGKAAKEAAQKLAPEAKWPLTKAQKAKLAKEQAAQAAVDAIKKPALDQALETSDVGALLPKLPPAQLKELFDQIPATSEIANTLSTSMGSPALHQAAVKAVEDWKGMLADAASHTVTPEKVGPTVYMNVFDSKGQKAGYFFQEGDKYHVKPPATVDLPKLSFDDPKHATAYSLHVSKELQLAKAAGQKAADYAEAMPKAPLPPKAPVAMPWSGKYQEPERRTVPMTHSKPSKLIDHELQANRSGAVTLMDKDWVENFEVSFTQEVTDGKAELVARFKVNEHRAADVEAALRKQGAEKGTYKYSGMKSLDSKSLELTTSRTGFSESAPPGVTPLQTNVGSAKVTMLRQTNGVSNSSENIAATHNLVEIRAPLPPGGTVSKAGLSQRTEMVNKAMRDLGIDTDWPTDEAMLAHKRAKILSYVDRQGGNELAKLEDRSPAEVAKVWAKAAKRNPLLLDIEADATLREVSPGHSALYSQKLADHFKQNGVSWLKHNSGGGADVLEQMFVHEGGLMSSRQRFEQGLIFRGMSTEQDFRTGGADSVFLRLETGRPYSGGGGLQFEIDPNEMGRMDSYFYNGDNYGKSGPGMRSERKTAMEIADLARRQGISSSNEIMMQRAVPPSSIRRVTTSPQTRTEILGKLQKAGINEINGVPVAEFIVSS